jgi:hypothetical protein
MEDDHFFLPFPFQPDMIPESDHAKVTFSNSLILVILEDLMKFLGAIILISESYHSIRDGPDRMPAATPREQ